MTDEFDEALAFAYNDILNHGLEGVEFAEYERLMLEVIPALASGGEVSAEDKRLNTKVAIACRKAMGLEA
jgi:hypothetical protein